MCETATDIKGAIESQNDSLIDALVEKINDPKITEMVQQIRILHCDARICLDGEMKIKKLNDAYKMIKSI